MNTVTNNIYTVGTKQIREKIVYEPAKAKRAKAVAIRVDEYQPDANGKFVFFRTINTQSLKVN